MFFLLGRCGSRAGYHEIARVIPTAGVVPASLSPNRSQTPPAALLFGAGVLVVVVSSLQRLFPKLSSWFVSLSLSVVSFWPCVQITHARPHYRFSLEFIPSGKGAPTSYAASLAAHRARKCTTRAEVWGVLLRRLFVRCFSPASRPCHLFGSGFVSFFTTG